MDIKERLLEDRARANGIWYSNTDAVLYQGILRFIDDYNYHRHHQGIDRQIPGKLYLRPAA